MIELHGVPLDAISKGCSLGDLLDVYMRVWEDARKTVSTPGKEDAEIFADTMKVTAYRIYLLGVEDGMKEENK